MVYLGIQIGVWDPGARHHGEFERRTTIGNLNSSIISIEF
jgi:hypothetical protein